MGFCHFASVSHSHSKHHLSLPYLFWPPLCVHWRLSGRERGRFQSRPLQWAAVSWRSIQLPPVGVYLQWCVYIYIAVLCLHNGKSTAFFLKTWLSFQCSCSRPWCDWFFFPFPFFFFFNLSCSFIFLSQKFHFFFHLSARYWALISDEVQDHTMALCTPLILWGRQSLGVLPLWQLGDLGHQISQVRPTCSFPEPCVHFALGARHPDVSSL